MLIRTNTLTWRTGILITWSPAEVDAGVQAFLLQIYPLLLSTLASIRDPNLTSEDIAYALTLCLSPLTIYLVFTSFCDLFGKKTRLYERITSYRRVIRAFAILVPILWLGLGITAAVLVQELNNGNTYGSPFDASPLVILYFFNVSQALSAAVVYPVFGSLVGLCLFRRRTQVIADVQARLKGPSRPRWRIGVPWVFMKCAWCVFFTVTPQFMTFNSIE